MSLRILLKIQIVQEPHDFPELPVFRIVFLCKISHDPRYNLGVPEMERFLIIFPEQGLRLFPCRYGPHYAIPSFLRWTNQIVNRKNAAPLGRRKRPLPPRKAPPASKEAAQSPASPISNFGHF